MQNIYVKPAIGSDGEPALVRDPVDAQPLDPRGAWKPRNGYWLDRVRDGDATDHTAEMSGAVKPKRRRRAK